MPYAEWKARHQKEASPDQQKRFEKAYEATHGHPPGR
jgi:hypothetical protein